MKKKHAKLLIWLGMAIVMLGLSVWGLQKLADLWASFNQGADPATALNLVPDIPLELASSLKWLPDDPDIGREMEPFTRTQIESAYLQSWLQWNLAFANKRPDGLKTYFIGPALAMVTDAVETTAVGGWQAQQVNTDHQLQLHFYSADGSIVSFTDVSARIVQIVWDTSEQIVTVQETVFPYDVVMFLEDGNWRVRHWVRRAPLSTTALPTIERTMQTKVDTPFRGVNYYPQQTPWDLFWTEYDPDIIAADMALMQELNLNSVRIFIPFAQFGGAAVDPAMLEKLTNFLDQAEENELQVIVTLFDFRTDYQLLLWPQSDRHLETLLTTYTDHPAVWAWDLKNEPDLDYGAQGKRIVDAWLNHTLILARKVAPQARITIGWSSPETAVTLSDEVDVVSFHYYAPADQLPQRYAALRMAVGETQIMLTEFGLPTWNSFFFPNGHSQPEQAVYYDDILQVMQATDALGVLAWTLYDFDEVPAQVNGRWPWQIGPQKRLGIIQADGRPKIAATVFASDERTDIIRPPSYARFLKPFWLTILALTLLSTVGVIRFIRKKLVIVDNQR